MLVIGHRSYSLESPVAVFVAAAASAGRCSTVSSFARACLGGGVLWSQLGCKKRVSVGLALNLARQLELSRLAILPAR